MSEAVIILVGPQMGENIGAAARVMKNFGLSNLRVVAPRDGWPNEKARAMAVGAVDIIDQAQIFMTVDDAIADLEYILAATAQERAMNKLCVVTGELATHCGLQKKIGILFGRENSGLTNAEISLANSILTIPTNKDFSSLNLAQAIGIVAYELFANNAPQQRKEQQLANKAELEFFFAHLFQELESRNFFKVQEKIPQMTINIRAIFNRIDNLSSSEVQTLRGIIASLSKNDQKRS